MEELTRDELSSFIEISVNYDRKKFYAIDPSALQYKKRYGLAMYGSRGKLVCFVQPDYEICQFTENYEYVIF